MALDASKMARGLLDLSAPGRMPQTPEEAGRRWAAAYRAYASDGQSPVGAPPASLAAGEAVLAAALGATFRTSFVAEQTATQIAAALTAFWLTPPVVFGAGVVTGVLGTSALASALPGVWASNQAGGLSAEAAAKNYASALDAFTRTVVTTTPGGPRIVGPIS